jgi:hypothetical protein
MRFLIIFTLGLLISVHIHAAMAPESIMGKDDWTNQGTVIKTWMNYSGPQIAAPNKYTTSRDGGTDSTFQHSETVVTAGYHVANGIVPGVGVPLDLIIGQPNIQMKEPFFGIIEAQIFRVGALSMVGDLRFYLPLGGMAVTEDFQVGVRTSQTLVYSIPGTSLVIGVNTAFRAAKYGDLGSGPRRDLEFLLAPFAKQSLTKSFSLTGWSGWVQLGHDHGKPNGIKNYPVNVSPGVRWDFDSEASINPYFSFLPSNLKATTVGIVFNARLL